MITRLTQTYARERATEARKLATLAVSHVGRERLAQAELELSRSIEQLQSLRLAIQAELAARMAAQR